jgi:UDP-N-acetyl-D-mannosaminuronic acid transferase (WecB/TagA/CpsF family)
LESSPEDVARELCEEEDKLRKQVALFEHKKMQAAKAKQEQLEKSRQEKHVVVRHGYSVEVTIPRFSMH